VLNAVGSGAVAAGSYAGSRVCLTPVLELAAGGAALA